MDFPFGIVLIAISIASLIWGIICAVIGGTLRFGLDNIVNKYLKGSDTSKYATISKNLVIAPNEVTGVDFGSSPVTIGIMAIIVGVLVTVYSLIGVMGGILKNVSLMFLFIGCILVSCMLQFVILWMIIDNGSTFHSGASEDLSAHVCDYKLGAKSNSFSQVLNSVMIRAECCGVTGASDFENLTATYDGKSVPLKVSPACCKKSVWDKAQKEKSVEPLIDCAKVGGSNTNRGGCYEAIFKIAYESDMKSYVILIIVIIVWQCLAMAVAVLILFQPKDEEKMESGPAIQEEIQIEEKKQFTPFSKLSSFQGQEVNRMRSTEIW